MSTVHVKLTHSSYPVVIGSVPRARLAPLVKRHAEGNRVFVIFDPQVFALYGQQTTQQLGLREDSVFVLPQGEAAKSENVLRGVYDFLLAQKISRGDLILACGGGVTTDLAGYAAATILRGIRWGAVPTTLLGMVDAAIGGKTGINHALGKNLIGAIWQPSFVSCNLEFLQTLPRREMVAGCGELVKYAGLIGEPMLSRLESYLESDLRDRRALLSLVKMAVEYKAAIVSRDEREANIRAFLNFGHTFGHAIEHALGYGRLLHGEAVILGLRAALALSGKERPKARKANSAYTGLVERCIGFVPARRLSAEAVTRAMVFDKKRASSGLRFVLLERPGKPYLANAVKPKQITDAVEDMLALYKQCGGSYAASTNH